MARVISPGFGSVAEFKAPAGRAHNREADARIMENARRNWSRHAELRMEFGSFARYLLHLKQNTFA